PPKKTLCANHCPQTAKRLWPECCSRGTKQLFSPTFQSRTGVPPIAERRYVLRGVAAGLSPAVEAGILPGGTSPSNPPGICRSPKPGVLSGRQDAVLYGSQDGRHHAKHIRAAGEPFPLVRIFLNGFRSQSFKSSLK